MKFTPPKAIEEVSTLNPVVEIEMPEGSRTVPSGRTRVPYRSVLVPDRKSCQATRNVPAPKATDEPYWPCLAEVETGKPALVQHGSSSGLTRAAYTALWSDQSQATRKTPAPKATEIGVLLAACPKPMRIPPGSSTSPAGGDPSRSGAGAQAGLHPDDEKVLAVEGDGGLVFVARM